MDRSRSKDEISLLVREFRAGAAVYKDAKKFDEAKIRAGFLDPLFEALGWPVRSGQRRIGRDREVVVEDRAGKGNKKRPDYGFYARGDLKFYVEAKPPSRDLSKDDHAVFQLKSYVWSERAPLGVLTDFEEFKTFHGAFKPRFDKPDMGRVPALCFGFVDYLDQFDLLFETFSRDAVIEGSIERLLASVLSSTIRQRGQVERDLFKVRGARAVDDDFLDALATWREELAKGMARSNTFRDGYQLTEAVQRFLDRLVFTRVAEDRGIERSLTLVRARERWESDGRKKPLYGYLIQLFRQLAPQFNGGLFSPHPLSDQATLEDDKILTTILDSLYFPEGQYKFDAMPVELFGAVYERFLGSVVRVTDGGHRAKVEEKPEVRHAGGVYYTPRFIVDAIVEKTVGPLVVGKSPSEVLKLRIIDPACGSGSFLLGAFQFLIDWHLRYFAVPGREQTKEFKKSAYIDANGDLRLLLQKKREILVNCIYGVDLDPQAVEVAQMSLYLKLLEEEAEETLALQRSLEMWKADKYLPDLASNLRCGNSLLDSQDLNPSLLWKEEDERRINAFDWNATSTGFGQVMKPRKGEGSPGFDAVIGNPPYIRVQELTEFAPVEVDLYKTKYRTAAEGNYDIYVVFIERCLKLLRENGNLGFIVPAKWWQAAYGEALRQLISAGRHYTSIFDFAHEQVFEGPTTYTCISIFAGRPTQAVEYRRSSPADLKRHGADGSKPLWQHQVEWRHLSTGPWYPGVRPELRPLFDRLRTTAPFLGDESICHRVFQGLKTGLDPVFVLDGTLGGRATAHLQSKALDEQVELESSLLHPLVKGHEMKRFSPRESRKVILFPYEAGKDGVALIPASRLSREFPKAWDYLSRNREALEKRERGRWKGPGWHQYSRNQALDVVGLPKLLTPDLVPRPHFSWDRKGDQFLLGGVAGGYGLLVSRPEISGVLLAILNSQLVEWMLRPPCLSSPFRGGWFSCEARFINLLPMIIPAQQKERAALASLSERACAAYSRLNAARDDREKTFAERQIETVEAEIDEKVFALYDVTGNERKLVEQCVETGRRTTESEDRDAADPDGQEKEE